MSGLADFWNCHDTNTSNLKKYNFDGDRKISEENNEKAQVNPLSLESLSPSRILSKQLEEVKKCAISISNGEKNFPNENTKRTIEDPRSKEVIKKLQKLSKDPTLDHSTKQKLALEIINDCPKVRHALEWMHRKYGIKEKGERATSYDLEYVRYHEFIELLNLL